MRVDPFFVVNLSGALDQTQTTQQTLTNELSSGVRVNNPGDDPVAAAQPSDSVRRKKTTHQTATGLPVHSFRTLLAHLGRRSRETCRVVSDPSGTTFEQITELDPVQREALRLLET